MCDAMFYYAAIEQNEAKGNLPVIPEWAMDDDASPVHGKVVAHDDAVSFGDHSSDRAADEGSPGWYA